eukprot:gene6384-6616_t
MVETSAVGLPDSAAAAQALRKEAERKALDLRARLAVAHEELQEQQALVAADADMAGHVDRSVQDVNVIRLKADLAAEKAAAAQAADKVAELIAEAQQWEMQLTAVQEERDELHRRLKQQAQDDELHRQQQQQVVLLDSATPATVTHAEMLKQQIQMQHGRQSLADQPQRTSMSGSSFTSPHHGDGVFYIPEAILPTSGWTTHQGLAEQIGQAEVAATAMTTARAETRQSLASARGSSSSRLSLSPAGMTTGRQQAAQQTALATPGASEAIVWSRAASARKSWSPDRRQYHAVRAAAISAAAVQDLSRRSFDGSSSRATAAVTATAGSPQSFLGGLFGSLTGSKPSRESLQSPASVSQPQQRRLSVAGGADAVSSGPAAAAAAARAVAAKLVQGFGAGGQQAESSVKHNNYNKNSFVSDAGSSGGGGWRISSTYIPAVEAGDEDGIERSWENSTHKVYVDSSALSAGVAVAAADDEVAADDVGVDDVMVGPAAAVGSSIQQALQFEAPCTSPQEQQRWSMLDVAATGEEHEAT